MEIWWLSHFADSILFLDWYQIILAHCAMEYSWWNSRRAVNCVMSGNWEGAALLKCKGGKLMCILRGILNTYDSAWVVLIPGSSCQTCYVLEHSVTSGSLWSGRIEARPGLYASKENRTNALGDTIAPFTPGGYWFNKPIGIPLLKPRHRRCKQLE